MQSDTSLSCWGKFGISWWLRDKETRRGSFCIPPPSRHPDGPSLVTLPCGEFPISWFSSSIYQRSSIAWKFSCLLRTPFMQRSRISHWSFLLKSHSHIHHFQNQNYILHFSRQPQLKEGERGRGKFELIFPFPGSFLARKITSEGQLRFSAASSKSIRIFAKFDFFDFSR